ncbi:hypothetical protein QFC20_006860 [Naganishia adeliensis]|uniref:Uncharacterized protein n=1 Tax=Naganishia adeliensis TaxID=92952 RepID=A0ACC2V6S3_9TREE|nr:hypothetical protein QFC20_006860 [Naganishia adeliensis]
MPCGIRLLKPIKSSTLFGTILQTPIEDAPGSHQRCTNQSKEDCARDRRRALMRPLERVSGIELNGGYLIPDDRPWTTNVILEFSRFESRISGREGITTMLECLKLAGHQETPDRVDRLDKRRLEKSRRRFDFCTRQEQYCRWLLKVSMTAEAYDMFLEMFKENVKPHPELLRNRVLITITAQATYTQLLTLANKLIPFYTEHATSPAHVLLGIGKPFKIFAVDATHAVPDPAHPGLTMDPPTETMAVLLVDTSGSGGNGMRFYTALVAAQRWE